MTVYAFPNDWTVSRVIYTGGALIAGAAIIAGSVVFLADGARNTSPAGAPASQSAPATTSTYLAPHCERVNMGGAEQCAWEPVADCLSDEDGDAAIPDGFVGCRWDAAHAGNGRGDSYVIWRRGN